MSRILPAISALGTTWYVEVFDEVSKEKADETFGLVSFFLADFEARYSRFRSDSIISRLNTERSLLAPDPLTTSLLTLGRDLYQQTNSVFNIMIGEHIIARGYDDQYSFTASREPSTIPSPIESLRVTAEKITLSAGAIDIGGFGKGFVLDQLATLLRNNGFRYFLLNGGGDMYATSDYEKPIPIYLEHPTEIGNYIKEVTLKDQGFAASSTHKRRWRSGTTEYSHIVDTRTIESISAYKYTSLDDYSIYTKAASAALADAWATTLLISEPASHASEMRIHKIHFARLLIAQNILTTSNNF